ncbi:MAG: NAD(+)/NADH kinase [Desulfosarcinaceae bacterium]|nr:NAD(+)/NADH kinase [Desulfosarcinaceae bacterium]
MKHVGLVVKADEEALRTAEALAAWLSDKGIRVSTRRGYKEKTADQQMEEVPSDLFCVFVLGGDGTFLSAVRWLGNLSVPILGIKFGEVGFLAESTEEQVFETAARILAGEFTLTSRMRLSVKVLRSGRLRARETVLNDVVVHRGVLARLADIDTHVDGTYLTTYRADGLIIATPTGSTAYALAAGGPVVHPAVSALLLAPICPFTLTNRPLILPDSVRITLRLAHKSGEDIQLTLDGQTGLEIDRRDEIVVEQAPVPVQMITLPGQDYYDVLKAKLKWSGGRG